MVETLIPEMCQKFENTKKAINMVEAALMPPGYMVARTENYECVVDEQFLKGMYKHFQGVRHLY